MLVSLLRACRLPGLLGLLTVGLWVALAACGEDGTVDPGPAEPTDTVHLQLRGDAELLDHGDYARLEIYSDGPSSQLILVLQTTTRATVTLRSPRGLVHPHQTVYEIGGDSPEAWSVQLTLFDGSDRSDLWAQSGFLNLSGVTDERVDGDFQFPALETDSQGNPIEGARSVQVAGTFSAHVEHTAP